MQNIIKKMQNVQGRCKKAGCMMITCWILGQRPEILATQLFCLLSRWVSTGFTCSRTQSMLVTAGLALHFLPFSNFFIFLVIWKFKRKSKTNRTSQPKTKQNNLGLYFVVNRDYISSPRTCSGSVMTSVRMIYWLLWPELKLSPKGLQSLDTSLAFSVNLWERWLWLHSN